MGHKGAKPLTRAKMMLGKLLAAFILIPLIEFILLVEVAARTSFGTTFLIVIATGILGSVLARREGVEAWKRFHLAMNQGRVPSKEIQDGLMIVFAGALLLTPGLLTDALGFLLLTPAGRALAKHWVINRYIGNFQVHMSTQGFERGFETQEYETHRDKSSDNTAYSDYASRSQDAIDIEVVRKEEK